MSRVGAVTVPSVSSPEAAALVKRAREELSEAGRYASSDPGAATTHAKYAVNLMRELWPGERHELRDRLEGNLLAASEMIRCEPDAFRGYCAGAALELLRAGSWRVCRPDA